MPKYTVTGEAYYGEDCQRRMVGEVVELPATGRNSVPPPGWLREDGTEVTHVEHAELVAQLRAPGKAGSAKGKQGPS